MRLPELFVNTMIWGVLIGLLGYCTHTEADEYSVGIGYICCSSHVREQDKDLNEDNGGAFIRYNIDNETMMIVGSYRNSFDRQATFVGISPRWKPYHDVEITIPMGLVTGYQDHPSPYALPTISFWDTFHLHAVPGVVYALSITLIKW